MWEKIITDKIIAGSSSLTLHQLENDECSPLSILSHEKVLRQRFLPVKDKKMRYYVNKSRKKQDIKIVLL